MSTKLERIYADAKANKWYQYFAVFCRVVLALGFIPSGFVKLSGERFTALPSHHPLGHYFDALHATGFYYTFIGIAQLAIAVLLLIPRTALLGAIFYFPVILNICVLAYTTRFEGTRITTLMLLANLYVLGWDYDRLRSIFLAKTPTIGWPQSNRKISTFPLVFFGSVVGIIAAVIVLNIFIFDIRPGNSELECRNSCKDSPNPLACTGFCDCIYKQGQPLDSCLAHYNRSKAIRLQPHK